MNRFLSHGGFGKSWTAIAVLSLLVNGLAARAQASGSSANGTNASQVQAPSLFAVFDGKLDSKTAKVGDSVRAKTTKDLKLTDLDIPPGSKLEGTITSVRAAQGGNDDSMLGIRFDRIEVKKDKIMRIQGLIVAIGPAPTNETGLGYDSVLSRGGVGSTPGLDPSVAADKYNKDKPDVARGSTLEGVALATNFDPDGATLIRGVHRNIKLNSNVLIRVAMFQAK